MSDEVGKDVQIEAPRVLKDPTIVNGMPLYTLRSYEPVSVRVAINKMGDDEVDAHVWGTIMRKGGTIANMLDDEWIHDNFPEYKNLQEMREDCRKDLESTNAEIFQQRVFHECCNALADRLEQRVISGEVFTARSKMQQTFLDGINEQNITIDEYMRTTGKTNAELNKWFDVMSEQLAAQIAAVTAFARERNIEATYQDVRDMLAEAAGDKKVDINDMMRQIEMQGRMDEVRLNVVLRKATEVILAEADIVPDYDLPIPEFDPVHGYPYIRFI